MHDHGQEIVCRPQTRNRAGLRERTRESPSQYLGDITVDQNEVCGSAKVEARVSEQAPSLIHALQMFVTACGKGRGRRPNPPSPVEPAGKLYSFIHTAGPLRRAYGVLRPLDFRRRTGSPISFPRHCTVRTPRPRNVATSFQPVNISRGAVVSQFDVEAALRRQLAR